MGIVDVPGDHFTMLPSATFENLPFWRTVFKTFVEWHHHEGSILHNRLRAYMPTKGKGKGKAIGYYGKGKKKALPPAATQPEVEEEEQQQESSFFKVGCFNLTPLKKLKKKKKQRNAGVERAEDRPSTSTSSSNEESLEGESESNRQSMLWLRQKMNSSNVSKSDQTLLEDFLRTIDGDALDELAIETLTALPERAQEILAEQLGISKTSISRMAKLSNRTTTLRIVIKSFLKTRK